MNNLDKKIKAYQRILESNEEKKPIKDLLLETNEEVNNILNELKLIGDICKMRPGKKVPIDIKDRLLSLEEKGLSTFSSDFLQEKKYEEFVKSVYYITYFLLSIKQSISYILKDNNIELSIKDGKNTPFHPLELELNLISNGKIQQIAPKKYTGSKNRSEAIEFYELHYKKYIDAGVISDEVLKKIDINLFYGINGMKKEGNFIFYSD